MLRTTTHADIQALVEAALAEMGWVKYKGWNVYICPAFPYHAEIVLGEEGHRAELELLALNEKQQYESVDGTYATPLIKRATIVEDLKYWLRLHDFPVEQILRTKRLRALLDA